MSAATVQQLSGGRLILGLGTSSPVIVQQWMGVPFEHPLTRVRETVAAIRSTFSREKVTFKGKTVQVNGFRMNVTLDKPPPIYLGAQGEKMLRLVGEIADGLITNFITPATLPAMIAHVREGQRAAGKDASAPLDVVCRIFVAVDDDSDALRAELRRHLTAYMTVPQYNNFFREIGFDREATTAAEAWNAGDRKAALAAVPDRMLEEIYVFGSVDHCRARLAEFARGGRDRDGAATGIVRARPQGTPRPDPACDRASRRLAGYCAFSSWNALSSDATREQVSHGECDGRDEKNRPTRRRDVLSPTSRRCASERAGICSPVP